MNKYHVQDNIYRIPVPVPFPMKYIYCYLIKGNQGWTLIDAGFNYEEARLFWLEVFTDLNIQPKEIKTIYLTHYHPDHLGLAGWMQALTGAPVYISPTEYAMVDKTWGPESIQLEKMREMSLANGVPEELTEQLVFQMGKMEAHVSPLPELTKLEAESVAFDEKEWQVIETPGHSDGHLCFYEPVNKIILVGDHILDKITPNISLWPDCNPNPLETYLHSLRKISTLDIYKAYPAHGRVIDNVHSRIEQLLVHHEERLDKMAELVKQEKTAFQVADEVFSHRELNAHQWRFALAETLAHLEYLFLAGRLEKRIEAKINYYSSN